MNNTGFYNLPSEGFNLMFADEGKNIGKLWFDDEEKCFKFEGDTDPSAKIFFDTVMPLFDSAANESERLRAALEEIATGKVNNMLNGGIMCRAIAKQALNPDERG